MTTPNQSTTIANNAAMTAERARKILDQGMVRSAGMTIHVYQQDRLSDLEQTKTADWIGKDIIVLAVKGNVKGPHGDSYVCEVAVTPGPATHSLLLNHAGVLGQQLKRHIDAKTLPFWASIQERFSAGGSQFYTFDVPTPIADALDMPHDDADKPAETALEDLPF
jgi:hypothetical protein